MEIQKFDLPPGTEVRLLDEQEMRFSQRGWRLIAVVPIETPLSLSESETSPSGHHQRLVVRPSTVVKYIVARDAHEGMEAARKSEESAQREHDKTREELRLANEKLKELEKALKVSSAEATAEKGKVERLFQAGLDQTERHAEQIRGHRKLEMDFGKLCDALGKIRVREILGT